MGRTSFSRLTAGSGGAASSESKKSPKRIGEARRAGGSRREGDKDKYSRSGGEVQGGGEVLYPPSRALSGPVPPVSVGAEMTPRKERGPNHAGTDPAPHAPAPGRGGRGSPASSRPRSHRGQR